MRANKTLTAVLLTLSQAALAGRGGSNAAIQDAIASGSRDTIIAEVERAEVLACVSCIGTVLPLVDHPDAKVRDVAAWWLAKRGVRDEVRDMAYVRLQGNDPTLARNAAQVLGRFHHPEAVPALSAYLAQPLDATSGAEAARALGEIGHSSALPALKAALGAQQPELRAAAAKALRSIRGNVDGAPLAAVLSDANAEVRSQAIFSIGAMRDRTAVPALIGVLGGDASADVRKHAAWALGQIGDLQAVPALTQAKADPDLLVESVARAALARMK